jgi:hypothetical protein
MLKTQRVSSEEEARILPGGKGGKYVPHEGL